MNRSAEPQTICPKCRAALGDGHYERADATCPSCGLVFAKYRAAQSSEYRRRVMQRQSESGDDDSRWLDTFMAVPETISPARFYAGLLGFVLFTLWGVSIALLDYRTGAINQSFMHGPLLVFHEAGHVIFRLFGEFATVAGGTLAQLLMPIVLMVALLRYNQDTLGASLALWLLGISLLDVAPYVYDAYDPHIILLNGATGEEGGHDWIYILGELNMLQKARATGSVIYAFGILTLAAAAIWAAALLHKQWQVHVNQ